MDRRAFLAAGLAGAVALRAQGTLGEPSPADEVDEGGRELFRAAGVDGAFVLLEVASGRTTIVGPELAGAGYLPASTFKIPNSLIALDTRIVPDAAFRLPWDGVKRDVEAWNRDHDLASAMRVSAVWYYQEVARRIGAERMQRWVDRFAYGNRDLGGGIDRFWLDGGLRIAPREQVDFLRRLVAGELPVAARSREIVRTILPSATADGLVLRAKTGLTVQEGKRVGWLVGWVERAEALTHVFATLLLAPATGNWRESPVMRERKPLSLRLLARAGVVPAGNPEPE